MSSTISSNFFDNDFEPHYMGNSFLYGLNTFECDSIIMYHDEIWKFLYFNSGTDIPVYTNKKGDLLEINLQKAQNVTRMQIHS